MQNPKSSAIEWHADGHVISPWLSGPNLEFRFGSCPNGKKIGSPCSVESIGCVVEWFINRYGIDCNIGTGPVEPQMEVAWSLIGDEHDLDSAQVWIVSINDEAFAGFFVHALGDSNVSNE